jgi:hypothetical protein
MGNSRGACRPANDDDARLVLAANHGLEEPRPAFSQNITRLQQAIVSERGKTEGANPFRRHPPGRLMASRGDEQLARGEESRAPACQIAHFYMPAGVDLLY